MLTHGTLEVLSIKVRIQKLVKLLIEYMQKYNCKNGLTI